MHRFEIHDYIGINWRCNIGGKYEYRYIFDNLSPRPEPARSSLSLGMLCNTGPGVLGFSEYFRP